MIQFCCFTWPVSTGGYHCTTTKFEHPTDNPFPEIEPRHDFDYFRMTTPLTEEPNLYRVFADLPLTDEGILSFADEWGLLLTRPFLGDEIDEEESGELGLVESGSGASWQQPGDRKDHWFRQIKTMKALIRVWDFIQNNDEAGLAKAMTAKRIGDLETAGVDFLEVPEPRRLCYVNEEDLPGMFQHLRSGHLREFAKVALCDQVDDQLKNQCSPSLTIDPKNGEPIIVLTPRHLQAALWFQFADAIAGKKELRQCERCMRYFAVDEQSNGRRSRSDKSWCSDSCRVAAYRERREMAIVLHQKGKTVKEIARQTGANEDSVRKWIKPKRKAK